MVLFGFASLIVLLIAIEAALRSIFGFGQPLLYQADPEIGYLIAPNQTTRRFGNTIAINQYSMRSPELTPTRPEKTLRVFIIGDSIANGGWWTDQPQTISSLLQQKLQTENATLNYRAIEVLNASANSWGPRNELAYLKRYGTFEAQIIILLINTDDLFATTPTSLPVGRDRNYPDRQPPLALTEVMQRYLIKPRPDPELQKQQQEGGDRVGRNLAAIQAIHEIAQQHNAKFLLAMTPLKRELGTPGPRDYERKERQRLETFTQAQAIPLIDFLPKFNAIANPQDLYHDHIHFNCIGNETIMLHLSAHVQAMMEE